MQLHIVGGFLGSGKTTGISTAVSHLIENGFKVGVITNDRGKQLVDSMFFNSQDILTVEIAQGCFRCNIDELSEIISQLAKNEKPDIVFAESVGSCGDLVATVIKPLTNVEKGVPPPTSYSVFIDSRLLQAYLEGIELPFSENVIYIFEKQIEESNILIINKIDLLNENEIKELFELAQKKYPEKVILLQNSKNKEDVIGWIETIENNSKRLPAQSIDINYKKYGLGEVNLSWLEQELLITTHMYETKTVIRELLCSLQEKLTKLHIGVGHVKLFISTNEFKSKISIPNFKSTEWENELIKFNSFGDISLLINARVEMPVDELLQLFRNSLLEIKSKFDLRIEFIHEQAFKPKFPKIPIRITNSEDEIQTINTNFSIQKGIY
jgi:G3E family GTPase